MVIKTDEELINSNPGTLNPIEYKRFLALAGKRYPVTVSKLLTVDQEKRIMAEITKVKPDWFARMVEVERQWIKNAPDEALNLNVMSQNKNFFPLLLELQEVATQLGLPPSVYTVETVWGKFRQLAHAQAKEQ